VPFPRTQIAQLLAEAELGATAQIRGAALEQATVAMIGCVPGIFPPVTNVVDYATAGGDRYPLPESGSEEWILVLGSRLSLRVQELECSGRRARDSRVRRPDARTKLPRRDSHLQPRYYGKSGNPDRSKPSGGQSS
jgi:hypothetical protein